MSRGRANPNVPELIVPRWAANLPSDWQWVRLWDVCNDIVDCPHSTPKIVEHGSFYMARTPDVLDGFFRPSLARRVSEATYRERVARAEPRYRDLLYSREGTYFGNAAEVPPNTKVCLGQRMVLLRPSRTVVRHRYLRYWLNSPRIQRHIHGHRDGSVAERLNLPTIRALPVCLPPLNEQRRIAAVLGALDDKIELNRKMNRTLEEMAQAIFKSWFIDFDPVLSEDFVDSEAGLIPRGWEIGKLIDQLTLITDGAHRSPKSVNDGLPMASVKDLGPWGVNVGTCRLISQDEFRRLVSGGCQPEQGDVLLAKDGARCLETVCEFRQPDEIVLLSSVAILRPSGHCPSSFLHTWLSLPQTVHYLREGFVSGSAIPRVVLKDLKQARLVVPPLRILRRFDDAVTPLRNRIRANRAESCTLSALRDTLLPRLVSGEIRVPEAENTVEALL